MVIIRFFVKICIFCCKSCWGYNRLFNLFLRWKFKVRFCVGTQNRLSDRLVFNKVFGAGGVNSVSHTQIWGVCRNHRLWSYWFIRFYW
jgi:hypothetical protein